MPHNNRSGNLAINNKNESDIYDTEYKGNDYMHTCLKDVLKSNFSVNYKGKVFLCCQDYYQKNIIGDLTKDSVQYILNTVEATHLRDQIYGKTPADKDLICRKCTHSVIDGLDFPLHHSQSWVRK
jgi:radical SAM protein with 4Fe4S-binding SPASM domain